MAPPTTLLTSKPALHHLEDGDQPVEKDETGSKVTKKGGKNIRRVLGLCMMVLGIGTIVISSVSITCISLDKSNI